MDVYDHQRLNHSRLTPWIMRQTWLDTLLVHYPVKKEVLSELVPPSLPIDTFDETGWVSIVPYLTSSVRVRGIPPIPGISSIPGFNIRTYVNLNGKPGVYFFSIAASNWLTVNMAKMMFKLPYHYLKMDFNKKGDYIHFKSQTFFKNDGRYKWVYRPISEQRLAEKGSLEEWLVERYCLYTVNKKGKPLRSDILHRSWLLHDAEVDYHHNSLLSGVGIEILKNTPIFHYSKKVEVQIWPLIQC
nr:DUF2071 domain-containing protein [Lysinibacillus timonensis]